MKKKFSLRRKITIVSSVLFFLGYVVMMLISNRVMKTYITKNMTEQFIHEDTQLARQAGIILEMGGDVPELQKFVEDCVSENDYIAYAVIIDSNVSAIAHSDTQKIGKSYADDTSYSVPAAQKGEIMTSQFWADVQQAWTYDVVKRFLLPYDKASKLLLPDDESFAGGRNLRMDTSNIEQYGIRMNDTITSLESIRSEFEELCRQKNIEL